MQDKRLMERIETGIPGYDELLGGGFFEGSVNVVIGGTGTGKTVFGGEFIYNGAKAGKKGMIVLTSEEAEYIKREWYTSFGWDFWELEEEGKVVFVDIADPSLRLQKTVEIAPDELIKSFKKLLESKIKSVNPDLIFIDSLEALFLAIESKYKLKSLVDDVFNVLREAPATCMIAAGVIYGVDEIIVYSADSITNVGMVRVGNNLQRSVHVAKHRGSAIVNQVRVLQLSDDGIAVLSQSPYLEF
ncbi:MAG: ATPase domain-containing protein [Euryarchaeota archaeon]|nr:ATPase domain-containing protein [Euryarchaeota archaeon]